MTLPRLEHDGTRTLGGADPMPRVLSSDSARVAAWTLVSRITGLARVIVIGATLGPTFFANIFQATNLVPNIFFAVVAGTLLTALLVPTLVAAVDSAGIERARDIACGFLGVVLVGFSIAGAMMLVAGPVIVRALTLGMSESEATEARHQVWVLLVLVVPQILLYAIASVAVAAQNARSRFALAAAAPAVENIGLVLTLLLAAQWFGVGRDSSQITSAHLFVLGVGATASVLAHAALQLYGAARAGLRLSPTWGWRDPDVRRALARIGPSVLTGSLDGLWYFALTVASGVVPGGVVAFQTGFNFYSVGIALGGRAVGTPLLPRLSRFAARHDLGAFRAAYEDGLALSWFVAVPAALAIVALASPLAITLALGELATTRGVDLLEVSVASLALALIGGSTVEIARDAAYARLDMAAPVRTGAIRVGTTLVGIGATVTLLDGPAMLLGLGITVTVADYLSAGYLHHVVQRGLPTLGHRLWLRLAISVVAAVVMVVPAALAARLVSSTLSGRIGVGLGLVVAALLGTILYAAAHLMLGSQVIPRRTAPSPHRIRPLGSRTS